MNREKEKTYNRIQLLNHPMRQRMTPTQLAEKFVKRKPLIHVVLDGWGLGPAEEWNAIYQARKPVMDSLLRTCPHTQLLTHGMHVGLPSEKDLGGSEVGHMTMGAGRVMEQGPTYIQRLIKTGEFFKSPVLQKLIKNSLDYQTPLHLIGLLSDGNIHSHIDHFIAVIQHAFQYAMGGKGAEVGKPLGEKGSASDRVLASCAS